MLGNRSTQERDPTPRRERQRSLAGEALARIAAVSSYGVLLMYVAGRVGYRGWVALVLVLGGQLIAARLAIGLERLYALREQMNELAARETIRCVLPHLRGRTCLLFRRHADHSVTSVIFLPPGSDLPESIGCVCGMVFELRRVA
jgi:hypothetical protein